MQGIGQSTKKCIWRYGNCSDIVQRYFSRVVAINIPTELVEKLGPMTLLDGHDQLSYKYSTTTVPTPGVITQILQKQSVLKQFGFKVGKNIRGNLSSPNLSFYRWIEQSLEMLVSCKTNHRPHSTHYSTLLLVTMNIY